MLYCAKCETLSLDGETCPMCGGKKLRPVRPGDPVLLLTTGGEETQRICSAFEDAGIPHEARPLGTGGIMRIYTGGPDNTSSVRIFVPYQAVERCREILTDIGVLNESGVIADPPGEKLSEESLSRGWRVSRRIFSAFLFLLAIVLVVALSDDLVNLIKSLFGR